MENETSGVVTPNVDVPVYWRVGNRDNSNIGQVSIQGTKGLGFLVAALQGVGSVVVIVRKDDTFRVELRVLGAAMDSLVLGPRDVGDTAHINFSKVDSVVTDDWRCWRWSGETFIGFWILSEEITYNCTPPQELEFIDNTFIKPFLSDLSGLLLAVDGI